jgi:hypothetical protein
MKPCKKHSFWFGYCDFCGMSKTQAKQLAKEKKKQSDKLRKHTKKNKNMKTKTLRKYADGIYLWRDYTLSRLQWNGIFQWNFCRSGSNKKLPCGKESIMFSSLEEANEHVADYGFQIAGLVPSEKLTIHEHDCACAINARHDCNCTRGNSAPLLCAK